MNLTILEAFTSFARDKLCNVPRVALVIALGCVASCTTSEEETDAIPFETAERIREHKFNGYPRIIRRSRAEYVATETGNDEILSDEQVQYLHSVWGRLGFFPPSFDMRTTSGQQAGMVGAFYSPRDKAITVFENPPKSTLVHELVHALQDQAFNLQSLSALTKSSDEVLASSAVIEGDAELCELRSEAEDRNGARALELVDLTASESNAKTMSEKIFSLSNMPALFATRTSFVYPYGALYAAALLGVKDANRRWSTGPLNAAFHDAPPRSTQEVLQVGIGRPVTPLREDVGLTKLPDAVSDKYDIDSVDRLGIWHIHVLMRPTARWRLPSAVDHGYVWAGDQLVSLKPRRLTTGAAPHLASGVVWTTAWASAEGAQAFMENLVDVHGARTASSAVVGEPAAHDYVYDTRDGELAWIERRLSTVVLVKGFPLEEMRVLSRAAFGDPEVKPTTPNDPKARPLGISRRFAIERIPTQ